MRANPDLTVRFVTNTTKESKETLLGRLRGCGFADIRKSDMFTSLSAAEHYVRTNKLRPLYLLTDDARRDFADAETVEPGTEDSVVVGLSPEQFHYEKLNDAFR